MDHRPKVIIVAGPNGAGKSTTAPELLHSFLGVDEYVNADDIAKGLSGFNADRMAMEAGRIMLERIRELANKKINFAFETTLSSRSFSPWIKKLQNDGYKFHLVFLWLPSADHAVQRVAERVKMNGHDVPTDRIIKRYWQGLANFFNIYKNIADSRFFFDNSMFKKPRLLAFGKKEDTDIMVFAKNDWTKILEEHLNGSSENGRLRSDGSCQ